MTVVFLVWSGPLGTVSKKTTSERNDLNCIAIPAAIYRSAFRARAGKCPPECFLGNFGHLPRSAPKSAFWVLLRQKAVKKHSLGHSEAGAQNCPKSTPGGTFRPGPWKHSCKWRPESQYNCKYKDASHCSVSRDVILATPRIFCFEVIFEPPSFF